MRAENETLAIKYIIKFVQTAIGWLIFPEHPNKFLLLILFGTHSVYCLTASWNPLLFLAFNLLVIYIGSGILGPAK
jgi:hypothetical protein